MTATGNPAWDMLPRASACSGEGDIWVWATRPHDPRKCYSPSRKPGEGVEILKAILTALADYPSRRLHIKCHPYDTRALYEELLADHALAHRVSFSEAPLGKLLRQARLVISEDSTAALEALFAGAPLIHAHLASCPPVLPLVQTGVALPGFNTFELTASIRELEALNPDTLDRLNAGRAAFCEAFAGPPDGRACERLKDYVARILDTVRAPLV
jgi:hypothetical protein